MAVENRNTSWDRIGHLPDCYQHELQFIYGIHMPIHVRIALTDWIDKRDWLSLNSDDPDTNQYMVLLGAELLTELDVKLSQTSDPQIRCKLAEAHASFRQSFDVEPTLVVRELQSCIIREHKLVNECETKLQQPSMDRVSVLYRKFESFRRNLYRHDERFTQLEKIEQTFVFRYRELHEKKLDLERSRATGRIVEAEQQGVEQLENHIKISARGIDQFRRNLLEGLNANVRYLSHLQHEVMTEDLADWHRVQKFIGNGQDINVNFEHLQNFCEMITEYISHHLQLVQKLKFVVTKMPTSAGSSFQDSFDVLENQLKSLLVALVSATLVVEKQPPQVMKTNTRFSTSVRLLTGVKLGEVFGKNIDPITQVRASIIGESQAIALERSNGLPPNDVAGEITNNVSTMEYDQSSRHLFASFRNMSLRRIKRADKKGSESVMDEKFCLLYQCEIRIADVNFQIQTQSLPVVVIVHGNQEPHAWATITWDNAFSEPKRMPFAIPETVAWSKLAQVLSTKFRNATGRGLGEHDLHFLATKAFNSANLPPDYGAQPISWSQVSKEPLHDRNFTFWDWFYAIMKVTREHLRNLWTDGLIMGFVSRRDAEAMLLKKHNGTFLLRFSDSELGGITIAWLAEVTPDRKEILMVQPFTARDFQIRSLADRVSDLADLVCLYPSTPRDEAFSRHYTVRPLYDKAADNGYVRPELVTQIASTHTYPDSDSNRSSPMYGQPAPHVVANGSHEADYGDQSLHFCSLSSSVELCKRQRTLSYSPGQNSNWSDVTNHVDASVQ